MVYLMKFNYHELVSNVSSATLLGLDIDSYLSVNMLIKLVRNFLNVERFSEKSEFIYLLIRWPVRDITIYIFFCLSYRAISLNYRAIISQFIAR